MTFSRAYSRFISISQYLFDLHFYQIFLCGSHGVMVSTLDSESSDPSSNLGGTLVWYVSFTEKLFFLLNFYEICLFYYIHYTQLNSEDIKGKAKSGKEINFITRK